MSDYTSQAVMVPMFVVTHRSATAHLVLVGEDFFQQVFTGDEYGGLKENV
jgi:hypothetical protein